MTPFGQIHTKNIFEKLSSERIKHFLKEENQCLIKVFDKTDSTNSEAKRALRDAINENAIFVAEEQTDGRGRRGKSFFSPNSCGLYFTAVLHPKITITDATLITSAAAVVVCDILSKETKKHPQIKWVNDIFIDGKKVCGILTEAVGFDTNLSSIIIGIGINLTTEIFPNELKDIAGCVGEPLDRNKLSAQLFSELERICERLPDKSFMERYRSYSLVLGKSITFSKNGISYDAVAEDILDDGSLLVKTSFGEEMLLNSGEISIKLD